MDQLYRGITEPTLTTEVKADPRVIRSQSEDAAGWREPIRGVRDAKHREIDQLDYTDSVKQTRWGKNRSETTQRHRKDTATAERTH